MEIYSQLDPRWKTKNLPNCTGPITIGNYGCLTTCIANIVQKSPADLCDANTEMWTSDGNMKTDQLLAKLGYKMVKTPLVEGQPLPVKDHMYIARTSWFAPTYPTHFFLVKPDQTIVDPASMFNPKTVNRYAAKVNEMRELVPISPGTTTNSPVSSGGSFQGLTLESLDARVKVLEAISLQNKK